MRGTKLIHDLVNAKTGRTVADAGTKMTPRFVRELEGKIEEVLVPDDELVGRYIAEDIIDEDSGLVYAEAGDEITESLLETFTSAGIEELNTLDIDHVNVGPYIRNTLAADKNANITFSGIAL